MTAHRYGARYEVWFPVWAGMECEPVGAGG